MSEMGGEGRGRPCVSVLGGIEGPGLCRLSNTQCVIGYWLPDITVHSCCVLPIDSHRSYYSVLVPLFSF